MKRYAIVIENAPSNYAAYVPDLRGCVATGATIEETENRLREAIEIHVEGLREEGLFVPEPSSVVDYVEVVASSIGKFSGDIVSLIMTEFFAKTFCSLRLCGCSVRRSRLIGRAPAS